MGFAAATIAIALLVISVLSSASGVSSAGTNPASGVIADIYLNTVNALGATYDGANGNLYVPGMWEPLANGTLSIISGASNRLIATAELGWEPGFAAVDYANGDVYVPNFDPGCGNCPSNSWQAAPNMTVVSGASGSDVAWIPTPPNPIYVAYDSSNGNLYVSDWNNSQSTGDISVVSGATNSVTKTIAVGGLPYDELVDPINGDVYVMDERPVNGMDAANDVTVISAENSTVIGSIGLLGSTLGNYGHGLVLNSGNDEIYAGGSNGVTVISGTSNRVIGTLPIRNGQPSFVDPRGNVYVLQPGSPANVSILSGASGDVLSSFSIGAATGMTYDPANGDIYSWGWGSDLLNVTSTTSQTNVEAINLGDGFVEVPLTYDPGNGDVYATVQGPYTYVAVIGNASTSSGASGSLSLVEGIGIGMVIGAVATVSLVLVLRRRRRGPVSPA